MISNTAPSDSYPLLQAGFREDITLRPWPGVCVLSSSVPFCSRKAGYSAHSIEGKTLYTALQVHILFRTKVAYHKGVRFCTITGLRKRRVGNSMPLKAALLSQA